MSSERIVEWLNDIISQHERILSHCGQDDLDKALSIPVKYDAIERCLQRISEAATRIEQQDPSVLPNQDLSKIRGFGNALRHRYERIVRDTIIEIIQHHLPSLCDDCKTALGKIIKK